MPTVIDSLIVKLELDPSGFTQGQKDASNQLEKFTNQIKKSHEAVAKSAKDTGIGFEEATRKALGFFAVVAGGRGMEELFVNSVQTSAAIGRLAGNINMSTSALSGWENAAKGAGGTAEGIAQTLTNISQAFQMQTLGIPTPIMTGLQTLGLPTADANGNPLSPDQIAIELANKFASMPKAQALAYAGQMNIDQGTFNFLDQGGPAVAAQVKANTNTTPGQSAAAIDLQNKWNVVQSQLHGLHNNLLVVADPWLGNQLTNFAKGIWAINQALQGNTGPLMQGLKMDQAVPAVPPLPSKQVWQTGSTLGNFKNFWGMLTDSVSDDQWNNQLNAESGGRQLDAKGNPLTSSAGAIGIAQLLPSTAKMIAQQNGIAWDENKFRTDASYNSMLGRLYMNSLTKKYGGDYTKALAAYNWGPGNVDADIAKNGGNWSSYIPTETRNYVTGIEGSPVMPSRVNNVLNSLRNSRNKNNAAASGKVTIGTVHVHAPSADPKKVVSQMGKTLGSSIMTHVANRGLS